MTRLPLLAVLAMVSVALLPAPLVEAAATWQTAPALPAATADLAAAASANGTLYAIGGSGGAGIQSTVYSFRPGTDTAWQTAPTLPAATATLAAATGADGTLYAIGGFGPPPSSYLSTVYSFKPGTDTAWQTAPPLPAPRANLAAATGADGTLYAIGGVAGITVQTVYSFKPGTDTAWQTAPSLPAARARLAAATGSDGTLYAIGGSDGGSGGNIAFSPQSTVYSFKPGTDTAWQTAPALPAALQSLAAATGADGTLYAIGGLDASTNVRNTVYSFKPGTDTAWQTTPTLPAARDRLAVATGADGTLYAIGGFASGTPQSTVYSFKLDTTAPTTTISLSPSSPNGQNGWYTSAPTVSISATDPDDTTGIQTRCTLDPSSTPSSFSDLPSTTCAYLSPGKSVTADGVHTIYAASQDPAGNAESSVRSTNFKLDQTPPTANPIPSPAGGAITSINPPLTQATVGGKTVTTSSTTMFGGAGDPKSLADLKVGDLVTVCGSTQADTTVLATAVIRQAPGSVPSGSGCWDTSDVTVTWNWADNQGGSGVDTNHCTTSSTSSGEGTLTLTATCTDLAGNQGSASYIVKVDKTPPTISAAATSQPNTNGWYNANVTIQFTCNDAPAGVASGVASCPPDQVLSSEGSAVSSTAQTATDLAGNTSLPSNLVTVKIDKTAPKVTDQTDSCSLGGINGWCRGTETSTFQYTDATSGMGSPCTASAGATCSNMVSSSGDGAAITLSSGAVTDVAGNTTPAITSGPFNIDATPPTVTCQTPAPTFVSGQSGATIKATVYDLTSGPQGGAPGGYTTISANAATATVGTFSMSQTGFDNAGNSSQQSCPYTVSTAATTTTVTSSASAAVIGQSVKFTATVSVSSPGTGTPSGSVTFKDGASTLGTGMLSTTGGVTSASTTSSNLSIGTHTLSAVYSGDTNFSGSPSSSLNQLVRYGVKLLYKPPMSGTAGSTVPIKIELVNYSGKNVSSATVGVTALCVVVQGAKDCSGTPAITYGTGSPFSFVATLDSGGGYQFNFKTTGLAAGPAYQLLFRAAGEDANSYHTDANAVFTLTK